jgi:hypothetical protein
VHPRWRGRVSFVAYRIPAMNAPAAPAKRACRYIALACLVLGCVLLVYMVSHEGEPGALPLLLVLAGIAGSWACRRGR